MGGWSANRSNFRIAAALNMEKDRFSAGPPREILSRFMQTFQIPPSTYEYFLESVLLADSDVVCEEADRLGVKYYTKHQMLCVALMLLVSVIACANLLSYIKIGRYTPSFFCRSFCEAIVKQLKMN